MNFENSQSPDSHFVEQAQALKDWVVQDALPFWANRAVDNKGGFYEDLDLTGVPRQNLIRRMRVQARQVFVFAGAAKLGWYEGAKIADGAFDFMTQYGGKPDGSEGFLHLITSDYEPHDRRRDLYDHAFYLLACASVIECRPSRRQEQASKLCDSLLSYIDGAMGTTEGYLEGVPRALPRRQNPHMHLFETFMALYDATGEQRFMDYAGNMIALFRKYFFDPKHNIIREYFDETWGVSKGALGERVEPGHASEWVWLLGQYEMRSGVDTSPYASKLYERVFINEPIFLTDEEDIRGNIRRSSGRLWVQCEAIRAHIAQAERGSRAAMARATTALSVFQEHYLKPDGTWHDQLDNQKNPIAATIPTSTFYHIFGLAAEAARYARL